MGLIEGTRRKKAGQELVLTNTHHEWKEAVYSLAEELEALGLNLCACVVHDLIGAPYSYQGVEKPNAMGATVASAAKAAGMRQVDMHKAFRSERQAGLHAVWGP